MNMTGALEFPEFIKMMCETEDFKLRQCSITLPLTLLLTLTLTLTLTSRLTPTEKHSVQDLCGILNETYLKLEVVTITLTLTLNINRDLNITLTLTITLTQTLTTQKS